MGILIAFKVSCVTPITGLDRPNSGKEDDDVDEKRMINEIIVLNSFCGLPLKGVFLF
jgi:hypothetical protein